MFYIVLFLLVAGLSACDKAPDGIIKESKMEDLLVDLSKAEGLIDLRQADYPNDSTKLALKQSIFEKHGITQADYDTSLVWYAHNIDVYQKVYKKVIDRLQSEQKALQGGIANRQLTAGTSNQGAMHKIYPARGDTANVWQGNTLWMFTSGMRQGYVKFDFEADPEMAMGDQYTLSMKLLGFNNSFSILLAADYGDGSVSFVNRTAIMTGWSNVFLQTDSSRTVRRIYGYIHYSMSPHSVAFVDSIQLLRMHLDAKQYDRIMIQKFLSPNKNAKRPGTAPVSTPAAPGGPAQSAPARQPSPPRRLYSPQPGVNKSGVEHIRPRQSQPIDRPARMT